MPRSGAYWDDNVSRVVKQDKTKLGMDNIGKITLAGHTNKSSVKAWVRYLEANTEEEC